MTKIEMSKIERLAERDLTLYTDDDLQRAKRRGRAMGWIQGGVGVLAVGLILKAIGWIPTLLVAGVVGYVLYRLLVGEEKTPGS